MNYLKTSLGRLRLLGLLEGLSLLLLIGIAMPLKYFYDSPGLVRAIGPVHGVLFVLFVLYTLYVGIRHRWRLLTIGIVLLACVIPFGTFYADRKILAPLQPPPGPQ
ncbi:DUF3817 domain-containing protein [Hymenobacter sp. BT175]|uniref:DUF3817 domain-containing protein n=1 Tax=Hymenobacter translucens TaxID=2886507 RepID=UPI001D0DDEA6|nr:DUF3817 domain-containing protein [Hymenobacter translucens]MCC2546505.1 DUF3817 domain-containing protein [Hymenobacter translucens]